MMKQEPKITSYLLMSMYAGAWEVLKMRCQEVLNSIYISGSKKARRR